MDSYRPELQELPEIARKDKAELGARLAAKKPMPPLRQLNRFSTSPTPQAVLQQIENAKKRVAYGGDKARLKRDKAQARFEERRLSRALENRDKLAGRQLRKMGSRREKFAGQRLKNFAENMGIGRDLFRVLRV